MLQSADCFTTPLTRTSTVGVSKRRPCMASLLKLTSLLGSWGSLVPTNTRYALSFFARLRHALRSRSIRTTTRLFTCVALTLILDLVSSFFVRSSLASCLLSHRRSSAETLWWRCRQKSIRWPQRPCTRCSTPPTFRAALSTFSPVTATTW